MTIYLYWHKPPTVFSGQVYQWFGVGGTNSYPVESIDVNNISFGAGDQVKAGQTLLLGSAAGLDDLGRVRVKSGSAGSPANLHVAWAEQGVHDGELMMSVGAYVTVLEEYRVWAKIPRIELQPNDADGNPVPPIIYMDNDIQSGAYPDYPQPVSNVGPSIAGTADQYTGGFDVDFDVNNSFQFEGTSTLNSISTGKYTWNFGGGTIITGTITDRQVRVRYPPGLYTASLLVTSDNNRNHISYRVIFVKSYFNNNDTVSHEIVSHEATPKGQEIRFKALQKMYTNIWRDGSLILIWEYEAETGVHRMIFSGWHLEDESSYDHDRGGGYGDTIYRCVDINGKLENTPGFSQEMNYNGTGMPTAVGTWNRTPYNHLLYFFVFILNWQSTALNVADLLVDNYLLPLMHYLRVTCDADNIYGQVNKLANMMIPDFYLTCLRTGEMRLSVDVSLMYIEDRVRFAPNMGVLSNLAWKTITVENRRFPRIYELMSGAIVEPEGYVYDTLGNLIVDTYWSIAPGQFSRGQGPVSQQSTNHLAPNDDGGWMFRYVEGNRYARLNSPWGDIRIQAPWDWTQYQNIDPGYIGRVEIYLAENNEQPPKPFPSDRFFASVKSLSISYSYERTGLTRDIELVLEMETNGPEAIAIPKPPGINIT